MKSEPETETENIKHNLKNICDDLEIKKELDKLNVSKQKKALL